VTAVSEAFDEATAEVEPTGNATVDEVLGSLEKLDGAPVSDHVTVFESAHEKLRGALADAVSDQQTS